MSFFTYSNSRDETHDFPTLNRITTDCTTDCKCGCMSLFRDIYFDYERNILTEHIVCAIETRFKLLKLSQVSNKSVTSQHIPTFYIHYISSKYRQSGSIIWKPNTINHSTFFEFDCIDQFKHIQYNHILNIINLIELVTTVSVFESGILDGDDGYIGSCSSLSKFDELDNVEKDRLVKQSYDSISGFNQNVEHTLNCTNTFDKEQCNRILCLFKTLHCLLQNNADNTDNTDNDEHVIDAKHVINEFMQAHMSELNF